MAVIFGFSGEIIRIPGKSQNSPHHGAPTHMEGDRRKHCSEIPTAANLPTKSLASHSPFQFLVCGVASVGLGSESERNYPSKNRLPDKLTLNSR